MLYKVVITTSLKGSVVTKEVFIEGDNVPSAIVSELPVELEARKEEIIELKKKGQGANAIKLIRSITDWGLLEVKKYYDSL